MTDMILVTGGAGYIGSTLVRMLLDGGYRVRVLDRLFFGRESLAPLVGRPGFELVEGDIRRVDASIMEGVAGVVDLAAISNDPAGDLDPQATLDINFHGRNRVAKMARAAGVSRYLLASSCSVYGFSDVVMTEQSSVNPLTVYAEANCKAEQGCLPLGDDSFCVTALRFATVYGRSYRMRFDLAVNGMTLGFFREGKIPVLRDGTQWRPFIHVKDAARAFVAALRADPTVVNGQVFNAGCEEQNVQILPLARSVAEAIGVPFAMEWYGDPDNRSYRVDFSKIVSALSFLPAGRPFHGAAEVHRGLVDGTLSTSDVGFTVKWYQQLLNEDADTLR